MLEYIKPLLERAGDDRESVQEAVNLGVVLWTLAEQADTRSVETEIALLAHNMTQLKPSSRSDCEELIRKMIFRHQQMFPERHRGSAGRA